MCELCGDPTHTDLDITIRDIATQPLEKIEKAIEILCKAGGIPYNGQNRKKQQAEISPYKAVRQLEEDVLSTVEERLAEMANLFIRKWLHVEKATSAAPFKINGRIYINPKTGKPLKRAEWKEIVATLERGFAWVFDDDVQDRITSVATAMGLILQSMADRQAARSATLAELDIAALKEMAEMEVLQDTLAFAQQHTAEYIVELKASARKKIASTIITATRDQLSKDELESKLFEDFGDLNRDWRRIAETEIATNFNNGYLQSELSNASKDEDVFMVGISAPNACSWCIERIMDHVVVLLPGPPPDGDTVIINGTPYEAIWPGKTNAGRTRPEWWVAAGSQHPHCRCTWTRTFEDEEFKQMESEFWAAAGS